MKTEKTFTFSHGTVDGVYQKSNSEHSPLILITNGHNGFYNYGMFPYIQEQFGMNGISSFSYNFSHGGVKFDSDYFADLSLYEKNCMRLETLDLHETVKQIVNKRNEFNAYKGLYLMCHSMGSVPTLFAAKQLIAEGFKIDGIILISCVKSIALWPPAVMEEWEKTGVLLKKNNRTKQELPQGKEFLEEIKQADLKWNLKSALKGVNSDFLLLHGEKDEAVPLEHSVTMNNWNMEFGHNTRCKIIPNATHTYNTKHPFEKSTPELEELITEIITWIKKDKSPS